MKCSQILVSVLVWSSRWKEERIIWASLTHRWPKALLYHSGDLPLLNKKNSKEHILLLQWWLKSPLWDYDGRPDLRSTLEMCVSLVLPVPHGSRRYCDSNTTPLTAPMRGLSSYSTDTHTRAQEPLHRSVRHDLKYGRTKKEENIGCVGRHLGFRWCLMWCLSMSCQSKTVKIRMTH